MSRKRTERGQGRSVNDKRPGKRPGGDRGKSRRRAADCGAPRQVYVAGTLIRCWVIGGGIGSGFAQAAE